MNDSSQRTLGRNSFPTLFIFLGSCSVIIFRIAFQRTVMKKTDGENVYAMFSVDATECFSFTVLLNLSSFHPTINFIDFIKSRDGTCSFLTFLKLLGFILFIRFVMSGEKDSKEKRVNQSCVAIRTRIQKYHGIVTDTSHVTRVSVARYVLPKAS